MEFSETAYPCHACFSLFQVYCFLYISGLVKRTNWGTDILVGNLILMLYKGLSMQFYWDICYWRKLNCIILIAICLPFLFRLEPVIIELERQRAPVVVISHQVIHLNISPYLFPECIVLQLSNDFFWIFKAVLRALYAYFADRPLKEIPHIEVIHSHWLVHVYKYDKRHGNTSWTFYKQCQSRVT